MGRFTLPASACSAALIPYPVINGAKILNLSAQLVLNYSTIVPEMFAYNHPSVTVNGVSYCNVTITYTHPGENDIVNTEIWAPLNNWNGRMQGVGGGGYVAGRFFLSYEFMAIALGGGYVGVTTDAGISTDATSITPDWAIISPGHIDKYALENLASVSLNDSAYMGKAVIKSMFGQLPKYSYFSGCSQGGRQGYMLAQRYPEAYDGIAASAPAINWNELAVGAHWPHFQMNIRRIYPRNCEMIEILSETMRACDHLDGVIDGIISDPDSCHFNPFTVVGKSFNCSETGLVMKISKDAATVVSETWSGPHEENGKPLWYGLLRGAAVAGGTQTIGDSTCTENGTCTATPNYLAMNWIIYWIKKNPAFDPTSLTFDQYIKVFKQGVAEYQSIIGTNNPDLSHFKSRGGKLISYHGLADPLITPLGTRNYYNRVSALDASVHDFYRVFEAPGLGHCYGGPGAYPSGIFDAVVAWVEKGTVPNELTGYLPPNKAGNRGQRKLCPYPRKARYLGCGHVNLATSYICV